MAVSEEEIQQVTSQIWESMLDLHPAAANGNGSSAR